MLTGKQSCGILKYELSNLIFEMLFKKSSELLLQRGGKYLNLLNWSPQLNIAIFVRDFISILANFVK